MWEDDGNSNRKMFAHEVESIFTFLEKLGDGNLLSLLNPIT
jgi:hypothetical protein